MKATLLLLFSMPVWAATPCEKLAGTMDAQTQIHLAQITAAGKMQGPFGSWVITPSFCRVAGVIRPSIDSEIHFEVWLPTANWNGAFKAVGNGGFAGSVNFGEMASALRDGYATASTDTGHRADGIDAAWALGHPEKIKDFGYRAIHEMTVKAKAIIESFYGETQKRSYFSSCSNGGRQALMEAQRFPDDYDGILAGAPAYYWTHLLTTGFFGVAMPMLENPASYISADKIPALAKATLRACDAKDGLEDGVISDPEHCHFEAKSMLCAGAETTSCLTAPQVASLERIYAGSGGDNGIEAFPGYEPGGELGGNGWSSWITGQKLGVSSGMRFATGFLRNMVFNDAHWTGQGTSLSTAVNTADSKMATTLNATDANLKAFQAHGGKLILYHGWNDAAIPAKSTISYYKKVESTMGKDATANFARLYLAPGMQHCLGGPGPNLFGEFGILKPGDAQHDIFTALVDWVEKGTAPGNVLASKYPNDNPTMPAVMTRPLCPYPERVTYDGKNYVCSR